MWYIESVARKRIQKQPSVYKSPVGHFGISYRQILSWVLIVQHTLCLFYTTTLPTIQSKLTQKMAMLNFT